MLKTTPYRSRRIMLAVIAWTSVCLIAAGWPLMQSDAMRRLWVFSGIVGLASAVGLSECLKREIRAQQEHIDSLTAEARMDPLTTLANRRNFEEELNRRWSEWKRLGAPLSLLLVDVDHFKQLNDRHGHQGGDKILCEVAKVVSRTTREKDLAARYGGDEFAVLLPRTTLSSAIVLAECLRTAIAHCEFLLNEEELALTVSIGVAEVLPSDRESNDLIIRTDASLYACKAAGRNCCYVCDSDDRMAIELTLESKRLVIV